ncbi:MAG: outer membrane lipoprotein LolB [Gammaproteobacteria bacterium]|nr:outer membrane lipoprotein LolB [Gammaproteobacteria bacterium]
MRFLVVVVLAFVVTGCVTTPETPVADVEGAWQIRQRALAEIDHWNLHARIAVRTPKEGGQASLQWLRQQQNHRLDLAGPFGSGRVRLTQGPHGAELFDGRRVYRDSSMQQLLVRATGWQLPLDGLNYWVLGLPAPNAPAQTTLDTHGRLKELQQFGWAVSFLEYAPQGAYELPSRIFIKQQEPELEVRLAIGEWSLSDAVPVSP